MTTRNPLWPNGCDTRAPEALRFLSTNDRPIGGETPFNAADLLSIAANLEAAAKATMPPAEHPSDTAARRIFPPVPVEDWIPASAYPSDLLGRGERLVVMIRDDEGNVGRAYLEGGTWWEDHGVGATKVQTEFEPTAFSFLPAKSRWACQACFRPLSTPHLEGCPLRGSILGGRETVTIGDTPPAERAHGYTGLVEDLANALNVTGGAMADALAVADVRLVPDLHDEILAGDQVALTLSVLDRFASGDGPLTANDAARIARTFREALEKAAPVAIVETHMHAAAPDPEACDPKVLRYSIDFSYVVRPDEAAGTHYVEIIDRTGVAVTERVTGFATGHDAQLHGVARCNALNDERNGQDWPWPMRWAEGLIAQLPEGHDGRDSWLLNHGRGAAAARVRKAHAARDQLPVNLSKVLEPSGYSFDKLAGGWRWSRKASAPFEIMMVSGFKSAKDAVLSASLDLRNRLEGEPPSDTTREIAVQIDKARMADGFRPLGPLQHRARQPVFSFTTDSRGHVTGLSLDTPLIIGDLDLGTITSEARTEPVITESPPCQPHADALVPVTVGGVEHRIEPGEYTGAKLRAALDFPRDYVLSHAGGVEVLLNDTVQIRGGERFSASPSVLMPVLTPLKGLETVEVVVNNAPRQVKPGEYTAAQLYELFDLRGADQLYRAASSREVQLNPRVPGMLAIVRDEPGLYMKIKGGEVFAVSIHRGGFAKPTPVGPGAPRTAR